MFNTEVNFSKKLNLVSTLKSSKLKMPSTFFIDNLEK